MIDIQLNINLLFDDRYSINGRKVVEMWGFGKELEDKLSQNDVNTAVLTLNFKDRPHISKSKMDENGSCEYLEKEGVLQIRYDEKIGKRYIAAPNLTNDLLVSVYNINSGELFVARISNFDAAKEIEKIKGGNLEARMIGLQNNQNYEIVKSLIKLFERKNIPIMEADLFGNQIRHVAIDAHQGMSLNILLLDRIYRPGELNIQKVNAAP
ncbi:hypothetical protein M1614_02980 [Candidatus Marsarchaeota archaeon]|nr:hypothetical protein [Candidatus Marsarchaeota archaeon]